MHGFGGARESVDDPAPRAAGRARGGRLGTLLGLLLILLPTGCGEAPGDGASERSGESVSAVDDSGLEVVIERPAVRVLSLVPSLTETVVALGAADRLVGRTDFDTDPAVRDLPSVGGGLDPSLEAVLSVRPDLVLSWDEGKTPQLRPRLERVGIPVFAVSIRDTADVFRNIDRIGALLGRDAAADSLAASVRAELAAVAAESTREPARSVLYLMSGEPPMTAGPGTFVVQLLEVAGARSIFPDVEHDWPQVSMEEIVRRQPDLVVVPVGRHRPDAAVDLAGRPGWREVRAVREGRVVPVDLDLLNRPGPRIGRAARELREAILRTVAEDG